MGMKMTPPDSEDLHVAGSIARLWTNTARAGRYSAKEGTVVTSCPFAGFYVGDRVRVATALRIRRRLYVKAGSTFGESRSELGRLVLVRVPYDTWFATSCRPRIATQA